MQTGLTAVSGKCPAGFYCTGGNRSPFEAICPVGYYCPEESTNKLACSASNVYQDMQGQSSCKTCPAGYYCTDSERIKCEPQRFSLSFYCDGNQKQYKLCPDGTYNTIDGSQSADDCKPCPPGYYCPNQDGKAKIIACPQGKYCLGKAGSEQGLDCPIGYYCPTGTNVPIPCKLGEYCSTTNLAATQGQCDAGYYCTYTSVERTIANQASLFHCTTTVTAPIKTYCIVGSSSATQTPCPAGAYCPKGSETPTLCPIGTFSSALKLTDASQCTNCGAGKFCMHRGMTTEGSNCEAGYYCPDNAKLSTSTPAEYVCQEGHYCPVGSKAQIETNPRYYQPYRKQASQIVCPDSYYCPNAAMSKPLICPAGSACHWLSAEPTQCLAGFFSPVEGKISSSSSNINDFTGCYKCTSGQQCTVAGLTQPDKQYPAGQYYDAWGASGICPQGSYCPLGTIVPFMCPPGTWSDKTSLESESQCTLCPIGHICHIFGITAISQMMPCPAGYYCAIEGASFIDNSKVKLCSEGNYCPVGASTEIPCPPGTYNPDKGQSSCFTCPARFSCITQGLKEPQECPVGFYCDGKEGLDYSIYKSTDNAQLKLSVITRTGDSDVHINMIGSWVYIKLVSGIGVHPLPSVKAGQIMTFFVKLVDWYEASTYSQFGVSPQVFASQGDPIQSSQLIGVKSTGPAQTAGTYTKNEGATYLVTIDRVYTNKISIKSIFDDSCDLIGVLNVNVADYYPQFESVEFYFKGTPAQKPCPAGTYNDKNNLGLATECASCLVGRYCPEGSVDSSKLCSAGYMCSGGAAVASPSTMMCPPGHYCPEGTTYPVPCPAGYYQVSYGSKSKSECQPCAEGYYSKLVGRTSQCTSRCEDGFHCIKGSKIARPYDRIEGEWCLEGHYCYSGLMAQCPKGTYQNRPGQANCLPCPAGYNCTYDGTISPQKCPAKKYCPKNTIEPLTCPGGTYAPDDIQGLEEVTQCVPCKPGIYCDDGTFSKDKQCDAGYFCDSGAATANDNTKLCPAGFFCMKGDTQPQKCPTGKFSDKGAKSAEECSICKQGYYCLDGSTQMFECPRGHYCIQGTASPTPCPLGTFVNQTKAFEAAFCTACPPGTLCNDTGISNLTYYPCPPGHYCYGGNNSMIMCPQGTYRAIYGGANLSDCGQCMEGFYCPSTATVVPEVCPAGSYCPKGTILPIYCSPGYYCPPKSPIQIICPKGFYCPGQSDRMIKCENGTYCPEGSSKPHACPGGTYGSGNNQNFDEASSCISCGRGQYMTFVDGSRTCDDCTPGYVCLGRTNTGTPINPDTDNGYKCPAGFYCPRGSYEERPCPVRTFNKHKGKSSLSDCIPCVDGYYNDLTGQPGCKKCGPTSYSSSGSIICQCLGRNRRFVKSMGSCLCENGYKPKDGMSDQDSASDCETIVKPSCTENQKVDISGNCVTDDSQVCLKQCPNSNGTIVQGTGVCSCAKQVQVDQVCNETCRKNQTTTTLNKNGTLTVSNPVTGTVKNMDPSSVPGFIGDFKCTSSNGNCTMYSVGQSEDGDFTYDYAPNPTLLAASGVNNKTTKKQRILRELQSAAATSTTSSGLKITNPVMCLKQGSVVLFSVDSVKKSYPQYMKDSILNSNPNFDYGRFLELKNTIEKGSKVVTAFSFVFNDPGIYVFQDSQNTTKITIIGVVTQNQDCSTKDANVQSATVQSLASIGIVPQTKNVQPMWSFIIGTFIFIILISFGFVTLVVYLHNKNEAQNIANSKKKSIYAPLEEEVTLSTKVMRVLCGCFRRHINNYMNRAVAPEQGPSDDITQEDLEKLFKEFQEQIALLKEKLKEDGEKDAAADKPQLPQTDEEEELIKELNDLRDFVNNNKECIEDFFQIKRDEPGQAQLQPQPSAEDLSPEERARRRRQKELQMLMQEQQEKEQQQAMRMTDQIRAQEEELLQRINEQSDETKQSMLEEFKLKISGGGSNGLSEGDKQQLFQEMGERLDRMAQLLQSEQSAQSKRLDDILAQRRKKKEGLEKKLVKIDQQVEESDADLNKRLQAIAEAHEQDLNQIDQQLQIERANELKKVDNFLEGKKNEKVHKIEEEIRKLRDSGKSTDRNQQELGDLLAKYSQVLKEAEAEMLKERQKAAEKQDLILAEKRKERQALADKRRREKEEAENRKFKDEQAKTKQNMEGIKQLIRPVQDEDQRMEALLADEDTRDCLMPKDLIRPSTAPEFKEDSANHQQINANLKKLDLIGDEEDAKIEKLISNIRQQSERSFKDQERKKQELKLRLDQATSKSEKDRLLAEFQILKKSIEEQQKREAAEQDGRLEEALRKRRERKQQIVKDIGEKQLSIVKQSAEKEQEDLIKANFSGNNQVNQQEVQKAFKVLSDKFENEEMVQVVENYLDTKNMQELQNLMLALFEERAKSHRKYVFDLMTQKQTELELIREEFRPRYDLLKERRQRGEIQSDDQYTMMVEKLSKEESERRADVEISLNDTDQALQESLALLAINGKAQAEQALKDKQVKERQAMLELLKQNGGGVNEFVARQVEKEHDKLEKELEKFKKEKNREKEAKIRELETMRLRRQQELLDKEQSLLNWEERLKSEEEKQLSVFERQKNAILKQKQAEQSAEIIRQANKGSIDALKEEHLRALQALETALEAEHRRQMEMLCEKMRLRGMDSGEKERVRREIKMSIIMKEKIARQNQMNNASNYSGFGPKQSGFMSKAEEFRMCVDKAQVMKFGPIYKKPYLSSNCAAVPIRQEYTHRLTIERKYKGWKDEIFEIIENAQKVEMNLNQQNNNQVENESVMDDVSTVSVTNLTFKDLIDHVNSIEQNYNIVQQLINPPPPAEKI